MTALNTDTGARAVRARSEDAPTRKPLNKARGSWAFGLIAWIIGILFVLPVLWMVLTSFHSENDAATNPPSLAAPLTLQGYREFFGASTGTSPWPSIANSLTASILSTALVLVFAIPAAYALSIRPVRKWTDVMFFFLSTKMLPIVAGLLPLYLFAQKVGLLDNIWLLIIFYTSMNLPIAVWMMRSFLVEVPVEILEAAAVDGAGLIRTLRTVVMPVILPGVAGERRHGVPGGQGHGARGPVVRRRIPGLPVAFRHRRRVHGVRRRRGRPVRPDQGPPPRPAGRVRDRERGQRQDRATKVKKK